MFDDKVKSLFSQCSCDSFKNDYYRSIWYLFLASGGVLFLGILQLIPNIIFACRSRQSQVRPNDTL
jgi:hypothetical protein